MLTKLELENFRCFGQHTVPLRPTTIVVGRNNAGKSTVVEALRLVSIIENRYQSLTFSTPPDWVDLPRRFRGVSPSTTGLELNFSTIFHGYKDPPARIAAHFATGERIEIFI